jgi:PKD repeat protein
VLFTNLSSSAVDFAWDFGDGNLSTNANPVNIYTNPGLFSVTLTATGSGGTNVLRRTNYILVLAPVVADFAGNPTNGVAPLTVIFTNLSSGAVDFAWDFGDGNLSTNASPVNTYTNPGLYSVSLIAIGPGGTNTLTMTDYIMISAPSLPDIGFGALVFDASNGFQFILTNRDGSPISTYQQSRIQLYSIDDATVPFTNWTLFTNAAWLTNGFLQYTDSAALLFPARFYRALEKP